MLVTPMRPGNFSTDQPACRGLVQWWPARLGAGDSGHQAGRMQSGLINGMPFWPDSTAGPSVVLPPGDVSFVVSFRVHTDIHGRPIRPPLAYWPPQLH